MTGEDGKAEKAWALPFPDPVTEQHMTGGRGKRGADARVTRKQEEMHGEGG